MKNKKMYSSIYSKQQEEMEKLYASPEELRCPVCQKSLAGKPSLNPQRLVGRGKQEIAMRNEIKQMRSGNLKEADLVVSAMCGHLFHRFCLRHYCYTYRQAGPNESEKVECPVCRQYISMIKVHTIDYKAHQKLTSTYEKEYRLTLVTFKELQGQQEIAVNRLETLLKKIEESKLKLHTYRGHEKHLDEKAEQTNWGFKEKQRLFDSIQNCNRGIDAMHKENINVIKMYLTVMKDQPPEFLRQKFVPPSLIPYLAIIEGDDRLMRKFGEILKPVEIDGLRSNTGMLIREILADVRPKAYAQQKQIEIQKGELQEQFKFKVNKVSPVVVKVKRSTVSICSRTALDKKSLKQILQKVTKPVEKIKEAQKNVMKASKKSIHKSASEIQILFKSKKRQCESGSAPTAPYEFGDALFVAKDLVPVRKCKSTDPILMKTCNAKGKRPVVLKVNNNQQKETLIDNDNTIGSKNNETNTLQIVESYRPSQHHNNATLHALPREEKEKVHQATHSTQTIYNEELKTSYCCRRLKSRQSSPRLKFKSSKHKNYERKISQLFKNNNVSNVNINEGTVTGRSSTKSRGFETKTTGSVLEMLFENMGEEDKSVKSLVDDVSRITFGTQNGTSFEFANDNDALQLQGFIEYKIDESYLSSPTVKENITYNRSGDHSDIESGVKISELIPPKKPSNINQRCDERRTRLLQGILPGPFMNSGRSPRPNGPEYSQLGVSGGRKQLPIYLSNWLKKIPSARTRYCNPNNLDRLLVPPPPTQFGRHGMILSHGIGHLLPPLPRTPLPPLPRTPLPTLPFIKYPWNNLLSNLQEGLMYENYARNRPYGDISMNDPNNAPKHTVIEIPSSNINVCYQPRKVIYRKLTKYKRLNNIQDRN